MKTLRLLCVVLFLGAGLWVGYLTWQVWQASDDGKWLFLLTTVFLLGLGVAPLVPNRTHQPKSDALSTRFAPHWFLLLALLVSAGIVLAAIVRTILRH